MRRISLEILVLCLSKGQPPGLASRHAALSGLESVEPHRAPLPITASGYLSWFTSPALVQDSGGPIAFVLQ